MTRFAVLGPLAFACAVGTSMCVTMCTTTYPEDPYVLGLAEYEPMVLCLATLTDPADWACSSDPLDGVLFGAIPSTSITDCRDEVYAWNCAEDYNLGGLGDSEWLAVCSCS